MTNPADITPHRHPPRSCSCRTRTRAFTLIELLVVISIIALLVGILLPALGAARRAAQAAVCLGHERGLAQGVATYTTDERNFLPGPNTSGAFLWQANRYRGDRANEPVQSWDWISPTLGNSIGFSTDPTKRYRDIFETQFKCPANDQLYDAQFRGNNIGIDPASLPMSSYTASLGFQGGSGPNEFFPVWPISNALFFPDNTGNKLDAMGPPSIKMWAMDGSRYVDTNGRITFDSLIDGNEQGGNFMTRSPAVATRLSSGSPHRVDNNGELVEASKRTGFRHSEKMNGVFLDGHAESFDNESSRNPEFYFPTGSTIRTPTFFVADVKFGDVLR